MALLILFCFSDARAAPGLLLNACYADQVVHIIFNHPRKSLPRKIISCYRYFWNSKTKQNKKQIHFGNGNHMRMLNSGSNLFWPPNGLITDRTLIINVFYTPTFSNIYCILDYTYISYL